MFCDLNQNSKFTLNIEIYHLSVFFQKKKNIVSYFYWLFLLWGRWMHICFLFIFSTQAGNVFHAATAAHYVPALISPLSRNPAATEVSRAQ